MAVWHKRVELLANVAIIVVAVLLGVVLVRRYLLPPSVPPSPADAAVGALDQLPLLHRERAVLPAAGAREGRARGRAPAGRAASGRRGVAEVSGGQRRQGRRGQAGEAF